MQLQEVSKNYDAASVWYDFATELILHRLLGLKKQRRRTLESLGNIQGFKVLDIGCGTGSNFPQLIEYMGPEGQIIGLDYSTGMLEKAERRILRHGWQSRISLIQGDAADLSRIPTSSIDAVTSVWCLGIVHDLESALEEIMRVLKPGGKVAIMDFRCVEPDSWLRWFSSIYKFLLLKTGIDSREDLDDALLREKWNSGRSFLRRHLKRYHEESYLFGGIRISGESAKPKKIRIRISTAG